MAVKKLEVISSKDNECIKRIKKLQDKKYREEYRCFIAEGIKLVKEAVDFQKECIKVIVFSQEAKHKYQEFYEQCKGLLQEGKIERIVEVSDKLFEYITTTSTPQGVLAECKFIDKNAELIRMYERIVIIDKLQDPGNLGTIIRAADAFGFDAVVTTKGTVDIYNPKTIRATMGSIFHLAVIREAEEEKLVKILNENDLVVYATTPYGETEVSKVIPSEKFCIVIGNESKGISSTFEKVAEKRVKIPMMDRTESLNAAVAASIVLYELRKR